MHLLQLSQEDATLSDILITRGGVLFQWFQQSITDVPFWKPSPFKTLLANDTNLHSKMPFYRPLDEKGAAPAFATGAVLIVGRSSFHLLHALLSSQMLA